MNRRRLLSSWKRTSTALAVTVLCVVAAPVNLGGSGEPGALAEARGATQAKRSVWEGVFSEDQAARGQVAYQQECARCHLDDLLGDGLAPALVGPSFDFRWSDLSVGDLFAATRATMPEDAPAGLSRGSYLDIISYLLKLNRYPVGDTELPTELEPLEAIMFTEEVR